MYALFEGSPDDGKKSDVRENAQRGCGSKISRLLSFTGTNNSFRRKREKVLRETG
jgi:hypothetical protein